MTKQLILGLSAICRNLIECRHVPAVFVTCTCINEVSWSTFSNQAVMNLKAIQDQAHLEVSILNSKDSVAVTDRSGLVKIFYVFR